MPARDRYHDQVCNALKKDGWRITHDPLRLQWGSDSLYVDLGAEAVIAAARDEERIAVEIKSFAGLSELALLESAIGQYMLYRWVMDLVMPERVLYLAISDIAFYSVFERDIAKVAMSRGELRLIVIDTESEEVLLWKTPDTTN